MSVNIASTTTVTNKIKYINGGKKHHHKTPPKKKHMSYISRKHVPLITSCIKNIQFATGAEELGGTRKPSTPSVTASGMASILPHQSSPQAWPKGKGRTLMNNKTIRGTWGNHEKLVPLPFDLACGLQLVEAHG